MKLNFDDIKSRQWLIQSKEISLAEESSAESRKNTRIPQKSNTKSVKKRRLELKVPELS